MERCDWLPSVPPHLPYWKESKYSSLPTEYLFQPVAVETLGLLNASAVNFLSEVGRRLTSLSGD